MWIMLIVKLPTQVSPPKLSIHWSVEWPMEQATRRKGKMNDAFLVADQYTDPEEDPEADYHFDLFGKVPNYARARKIHYKGEDIRVFPHEFSVLKRENLRLYVLGDDHAAPSHEYVPGDAAAETIQEMILEGDMKMWYDAALIDGATPAQAMAVAQGIDISLPDAEFPPTGWYRCLRHYAEIYCKESEMHE